MRIWDESRVAVNAIEMSQNGNYIVAYYDGQPEMWNTKPPMAVWMQVVMIKLMGISELSVRLPSAITALLTIILIGIFCFKITKSIWHGVFAMVILTCSQGYVALHGTRTADYDAPLTLFSTLYALLFISYLLTNQKKYFYLFFLSIILAGLTKGIAGFMLLPGIALYTILSGNFKKIITDKITYLGTVGVLISVGGYYLLRESVNPGFLNAVWNNELAGRYLENLEGHAEPFGYYFDNLFNYQYTPFFSLLMASLLGHFFLTDKKLKIITGYLSMTAITFFLISSNSVSKMEHYILPVYPLFAILIATIIYSLIKLLQNNLPQNQTIGTKGLFPITFALIFTIPYYDIFNTWYKPKDNESTASFYSYSYVMKDLYKNPRNITSVTLIHNDYKAQFEFYRHMLAQKDIEIKYKSIDQISAGETIIIHNNIPIQKANQLFDFAELKAYKDSKLLIAIDKDELSRQTSNNTKEEATKICGFPNDCQLWNIYEFQTTLSKDKSIQIDSDFDKTYNCEEAAYHIEAHTGINNSNSIFIDSGHLYSASFRCSTQQLHHPNFIKVKFHAKSELPTKLTFVIKIMKLDNQVYEKDIEFTLSGNNVWENITQNIPFEMIHSDNCELLLFFTTHFGEKINLDNIEYNLYKF